MGVCAVCVCICSSGSVCVWYVMVVCVVYVFEMEAIDTCNLQEPIQARSLYMYECKIPYRWRMNLSCEDSGSSVSAHLRAAKLPARWTASGGGRSPYCPTSTSPLIMHAAATSLLAAELLAKFTLRHQIPATPMTRPLIAA